MAAVPGNEAEDGWCFRLAMRGWQRWRVFLLVMTGRKMAAIADAGGGCGWRVRSVPSFFCCKIRRGSVWYGSGEFYERRGAEMTRYRLNNIKLPLEAGAEEVWAQTVQRVGSSALRNFRVAKKSLDARRKDNLFWVYAAEFEHDGALETGGDLLELAPEERLDFTAVCRSGGAAGMKLTGGTGIRAAGDGLRPVVAGSGPAGMMAALCLAEAGLRPIVLERGAAVRERQKAVQKFWATGELAPETNVQFGEGGAGTFSDGKLMTGIKKDKYTAKVLEEFVKAGAPGEILYLAKPHIGTDNLALMVENIRHKVESFGGEYRFGEKLADLRIDYDGAGDGAGNENGTRGVENRNGAGAEGDGSDGATCGAVNEGATGDAIGAGGAGGVLRAAVVERADGTRYELPADTLILAVGHSARDTFRMLYGRGLEMTQKPFAVGVRIEHKQADVNLAQYGKKYCCSRYLGAADYKLAEHLDGGRSVYTFCMCPGGTVVAATSLEGHVVTNGMSEFARDKENANAAVLVNVDERDFGSAHPLAGIEFQEKLEKKAFALGGGTYFAPVQKVGDFLAGRGTLRLGAVKPSYKPGVMPADFRELFDAPLYKALQEGIRRMDRKLRGFAADDAVLTAVESRSSSPVRIVRGADYMSNIHGVYPAGEGAGYAGGITSAAADGVKLAAAICGIG